MVDIIHTSAGKLGYESDNGHLDFYVNGGSTQKGCTVLKSFEDFKSESKFK
jgi:hypothetical protein